MDQNVQQALRRLPSIDELLLAEETRELLSEHGRDRVVEALRAAVARAREDILAGAGPASWEVLESTKNLVGEAGRALEWAAQPHLRRIINASGVVVHTNLGRSNLAPSAAARAVEAASHYTNLEFDLSTGIRGSRHDHVERLLTALTGAEAGMVVNNNAAAVLLMLAGLAAGGEVVVSRGQLVEIGGSFRIPAIMELSGARLVEVGTTNKTHLHDYEGVIGPETRLLLRVHTSNFKVVGFSEEVPIAELVALGRRHNLLVADDLGSGALADLPAFRDEPSVASSLEAGAGVVSFSGDKLLGGPQAGILLGQTAVIARLKKHPLARALRVDKMTLAALEGTLLLYQNPERARSEIPTLRYLSRTPAETRALATTLRAALEEESLPAHFTVEETTGKAGGGSLPLLEIPSYAVVLRRQKGDMEELAALLRGAGIPVVGRVAHEALYLDCLALEEDEVPLIVESLRLALDRAPVESGAPASGSPE